MRQTHPRHFLGRIGFGATLLLLSAVLPVLAAAPEETPVWIEVSIDASGKPVARPEVAVLSVSRREYAQWRAAEGQDIDFEIVMRDGGDRERKLPNPSCERKGRCRSQVPTLKNLGRHAYDVIVKTETATLVLDPEVEIER
jgi:hypothetical protein